MHSYIKSLHAAHVGPFDSLNIRFTPDVNIIVGPNASGKTSILKILSYCFTNSAMDAIRFRRQAEYWASVQAIDHTFIAGVRNIVSKDQEFRRINVERWDSPPSQDGTRTYLPYEEGIPHYLFAIGANRRIDYKRKEGMVREDKGRTRVLSSRSNNIMALNNSYLPDIKQWMINRYFVVEKDWAKNEAANWNFILERLPYISPPHARIKFNRIERDLEPIFSLNDKDVYLEELSSGFKSFLSIIFSICDWIEGINENDSMLIKNANGTVLIDEIDTHLHPEWQAIIIGSLKVLFPKIQFIVTSHSPLVIANAQANQVIRINQNAGTLDLQPDERNYRGWQLEYILEDIMQTIRFNQLSSDQIFEHIDRAYDGNNILKYNEELEKLKQILNPRDPVITYYEIKRSNLFLKNDQGQENEHS
jgi:hypothetical protein